MSWFVYILLCSDGSFYVGHTQDLAQRLAAHNAGKGASYTAARHPVEKGLAVHAEEAGNDGHVVSASCG